LLLQLDDQAIAFFSDAFAPRKIARDSKRWPISASSSSAMSFVVAMRLLGTIRMCVGARPYVAKSRDKLVAINDVGGQLARDDALEKSVHAEH